MIKKIIKKYWILLFFVLLINIPIFLLGIIRTNKEITNTGDLIDVSTYLQVENKKEQKGSLSSVYVVSFNNSTILQNLLFQNNKKIDIDDIPTSYLHLTDKENYDAGQVQKESSIASSIICAYEAYNKYHDDKLNINYTYEGLKVSFYKADSEFRIGDIITKINDLSAKESGRTEFRNYLSQTLNDMNIDTYTVIRNGQKIEIDDTNYFYGYDWFNLDYETLNPKISINKTNTGGPSAGFMQALEIYNQLIDKDITEGHKLAGTGTINVDGTVGEIGAIKQKIYTAASKNVEIFFCPPQNYEEAKEALDDINTNMKLLPVSTFELALRLTNAI